VLLTGTVVTPDEVVPAGAVVVDDGRIRFAGRRSAVPPQWQQAALPPAWDDGVTLLPGLVDIHCHGGDGGEFGPDRDASLRAARHHLRAGSTTLVGSLVSAPASTLVAGARVLAALVDEGDLAGVHLEGPFLSQVRCGAQDPAALVDPDAALVEQLVDAAGGGLAHMTFAPERPGAAALVTQLAAAGTVPSVGHTDATFAEVAAVLTTIRSLAPRGGLPLVTHLFNGMPPLLSRAPGPVGATLAAAARGEAVVEVIADGVHLDAGTVRMVHDAVGPDHLVLVSDAVSASGLPDGRYTLGGLAVAVRGSEVRLVEGGSLAGGVSTLLDQVRWCVDVVGLPLLDAVRSASRAPARALALPDVGELVEGTVADVVVTGDDLALRSVMRRGEWL
jgi:N-acetylglucosamine-6-phosphate deacetylase